MNSHQKVAETADHEVWQAAIPTTAGFQLIGRVRALPAGVGDVPDHPGVLPIRPLIALVDVHSPIAALLYRQRSFDRDSCFQIHALARRTSRG
jgi:hypothetical protein